MREKKAKRIRKEVYGDLGAGPLFRKYKRLATGQIVADEKRREYQNKKRGR